LKYLNDSLANYDHMYKIAAATTTTTTTAAIRTNTKKLLFAGTTTLGFYSASA